MHHPEIEQLASLALLELILQQMTAFVLLDQS
jgi:hypothetical protein